MTSCGDIHWAISRIGPATQVLCELCELSYIEENICCVFIRCVLYLVSGWQMIRFWTNACIHFAIAKSIKLRVIHKSLLQGHCFPTYEFFFVQDNQIDIHSKLCRAPFIHLCLAFRTYILLWNLIGEDREVILRGSPTFDTALLCPEFASGRLYLVVQSSFWSLLLHIYEHSLPDSSSF